MRCQKRVDPGGIGLEPGFDLRRQERDFGLGGAIKAEDAHLSVGCHRLRPENLGEPSGAIAALQLHLQQPVLGMDKAEPKGGVRVVTSGDQRHAVGVALDPNCAFGSGSDDAAVELRQR